MTIPEWITGGRMAVGFAKGAYKVAMWVSRHHMVEFYDSLKHAPTVSDYTAQSSEIWLNLFNGARAESDNLLINPKVKKILFPCPDHNGLLKTHYDVQGKHGENFPVDIRRRTRLAQSKNIEVRWVDHATPESMLISNPLDPKNGRILFDIYLPYLDSTGRPRFEVTTKHERLYADLLESFNKTWDKAHLP